MSVELFRVYLRDIDKENGYKRSANKQRLKLPVEIMPVAEKPKSYDQKKLQLTPPKSAEKLGQAEAVAAAVDLTKQTFANKHDTSKYNAD